MAAKIKTLAAQRYSSANPISQLGENLRHVDFPEPKIPGKPRPVVIPGGKKRRPKPPRRPPLRPIGTRKP